MDKTAPTTSPLPERQADPRNVRTRRSSLPRRLYRGLRGTLAGVGLIYLLLVLTPLTKVFYAQLDASSPPEPADAIVCLGGGDLRLLYAAQCYAAGYAPKVVVCNNEEMAPAMARTLAACGVPREAIILDPHSYTTAHHPGGVAAATGLDPATARFLIVTSRMHSLRTALTFRRAGYRHFSIYVGPHPPKLDLALLGPRRRAEVLPSLLYEYAALVKYWIDGKI